MEMKWNRLDEGSIDEPIMDYLERIFEEEYEKGNSMKVCVGTDSQKYGGTWKFATVIALLMRDKHGAGKGAKVIFSKYSNKDTMSINERMVREVAKSVEVAYEIYPLVDLYDFQFEVHADINPDPKWKSNRALSEAIGLILGMGFDYKVKPHAYAAMACADRLC